MQFAYNVTGDISQESIKGREGMYSNGASAVLILL